MNQKMYRYILPAFAIFAGLGLGLGCGAAESDEDEQEIQDKDALGAAKDTLSGVAQVHVVDYADHSETIYYVQTDDDRLVRVDFAGDHGPVMPEEPIALVGRWNKSVSPTEQLSFTATSMQKQENLAPAQANAVITKRSPLAHKVAVIVLGPTNYTHKQLWNQVNPTAGSAASYIGENSGNVDTFKGDVFGPYVVDASDCKTRAHDIQALAKAAAVKDGHDLSSYSNIAVIFPKSSACPFLGSSPTGKPGGTTQLTSNYFDNFECGVVAHELGHSLGLNHARSAACPGALYSSNRSGCEISAYGDPFDVMGHGGCAGHYAAPAKEFMGWLTTCEDVTAGGSKTFNLSPLEGTCGLRSLRIPIPGESESRFYYLEYRKKSAGAFAGALGQDRVVLSVSTDGHSTASPDRYRLDATPGTQGNFSDGSLAIGTTYNLPGNIHVKVLEVGGLARVQVTMPSGAGAKCRNGENPPADAQGRIGVACGG